MEKGRKNRRQWLILLLVVCVIVILAGGASYMQGLRNNLAAQSVRNVLTVTRQQQQAFDSFIANDVERLHGFATYFANSTDGSPQNIRNQLRILQEIGPIYSVMCLDDGWFCSNASDKIRLLSKDQLKSYSALEGSGVRESFIGMFSGNPRFGYYEAFTFSNGHHGLIQKSYDCSEVLQNFSFSFYNEQGFAYVVNDQGDILLGSSMTLGDTVYNNIFDILASIHGEQDIIDDFRYALEANESGSARFAGARDSLVYTYVPVESVDGWHLVSVVPEKVITEEADQILHSSQIAFGILAAVLAVGAILLVLGRNTQKEIEKKDREIEYQIRLFDIFSSYLSRNVDDVYMMFDFAQNKFVYISPNAERVLGLSPEKIAANPHVLEDAYVDVQRIETQVLRDMPANAALKPVDAEWINPRTGEHKWFHQNVYTTQIQGRDRLVVYISDRTRERKTQADLKEALQMAKAANDAKSSFLSNVSHDIRTPMNAIIGFLALMKDEVRNPEMMLEYIRRIETASQHLLGLINDVLDMNKIESGSTTLNIGEIELAELINEINAFIRPQANAKNQTFDILVASLAYERVMGDKVRINQILINLLSNAVKYTPAGGSIRLGITELPRVLDNYSRIRFTVADNGMGMSEEYLKVIFDPFTREDTEAANEIQGTGLGMAITHSLVKLMGGTIKVESTPGEGTTFTVELELPIQETVDEEDTAFWSEHKLSRMVVVDDDEEICKNIVRLMKKTGVATDYSTEGEKVVRMMQEARDAGWPYGLILLDWKMPHMDGLETARLIREKYPDDIPILLLTAYDWSEIEQEANEIDINHFMPKPFFMSTFKAVIRRVMDQAKPGTDKKEQVVEGKKILVVDDIEVNRIILAKILSTLGAQCEMAKNGREAVEIFATSLPDEYDLILMDVQMPVMNGYAATREIRASTHPSAQEVPIIAMTANAFVDDVRDAINSGMDAHIAKPVQLNTLKSTIQQVMEKRGRS